MAIKIFHIDSPSATLPMIASDARLVVWPGVGALTANMNFVDMQSGETNVPHAHRYSEDTIFILDGFGTVVDLTNDVVLQFEAGDVVHVPPGVRHAVSADRQSNIVSVGGPCPADEALLRGANPTSGQ
jgi:quercetin dioxygenase-like cupin family protein